MNIDGKYVISLPIRNWNDAYTVYERYMED